MLEANIYVFKEYIISRFVLLLLLMFFVELSREKIEIDK